MTAELCPFTFFEQDTDNKNDTEKPRKIEKVSCSWNKKKMVQYFFRTLRLAELLAKHFK